MGQQRMPFTANEQQMQMYKHLKKHRGPTWSKYFWEVRDLSRENSGWNGERCC